MQPKYWWDEAPEIEIRDGVAHVHVHNGSEIRMSVNSLLVGIERAKRAVAEWQREQRNVVALRG